MADKDQATVTLHWLNGSRAQRILWLLIALDVPYDLKIYHRAKTAFAPPELVKVHPLGKSPVITIQPPAGAGGGAPAEPIVLAESGYIVEYLCEHWGRHSTLLPTKWQEGKEGQVGGETAAWLRHKYLMHFAEGTFMPYLVMFLVTSVLKSSQVPWLVRPISSGIANKINSSFVVPNVRKNLALVESFLATPPAPGDGEGYLCGGHLTAADILMSYPLQAVLQQGENLVAGPGESMKDAFPKTFAYIDRLEKEPGYLQSVKKIEEVDGKFAALPESN